MIQDQIRLQVVETGGTAILQQARQYLFSVHRHLIHNEPGQFPPIPPAVDQLLDFTKKVQAQVLVNQTLASDDGTDKLVRLIEGMLEAVTALLAALEVNPAPALRDIDFAALNATLDQERIAAESLANDTSKLLHIEVPLITDQTGSETGYWIPLTKLQGKGSEELYRMITNAVPVDPQVRRDINAFLEGGLHIAASDPRLVGKAFSADQLATILVSPDLLEAVAVSAGAYLSKALQETPKVFDDEFRDFYQSLVTYLRKTPAATVQPTNTSAVSANKTIPIRIPSRTPSIPTAVPTSPLVATPNTDPSSAAAPADQPGTTVDFRHDQQAAPQPPATQNPQPGIKPINLP